MFGFGPDEFFFIPLCRFRLRVATRWRIVSFMNKQITVESFRVFEDASGAPAVITVDGFSFSFDCLGGRTDGHLITKSNRSPSKRAVSLAAWKYAELCKDLSAEWQAANLAMYSDAPSYC
jgi:hypothetical protein